MVAIFIDRDGTLIKEPETEVVNTWEKFQIKSDTGCLANLPKESKIFVLSNQEGINGGKLDWRFYEQTNIRLLSALNNQGVKIEKIYTCPHAIDEDCSCRKPKTGLVKQVMQDYEIARENSWVIGDRKSDVLLAKACGFKSVLIESQLRQPDKANPSFIAKNLCEAAQYITEHL